MNRTLGAILLVIGTCVGAGILALPIISSFSGFWPAVLTLSSCWFFLYLSALFLLEVNLASPDHSNLISMAGKTLGIVGQVASWILTTLLLYSLLTAYIAGSSTFFTPWLPRFAAPLPVLLLFGVFVYLGTAQSDRLNRGLVLLKATAFLFLIALLPRYIQPALLTHVDTKAVAYAFPVTITAFGFHTIIPVITPYLNHDRKKLRFVLFVGSIIPLSLYLLWDFLVMGSVPLPALIAAFKDGDTAATPLVAMVQTEWLSFIAGAFPFISILSSFLGVALSLSNFLTDGLRLRRYSYWKEMAALLTFIPPFAFFLINPHLFISALSYAGMFVALLLGAMPALMAWNLPHLHRFRPAMVAVILFSCGIVVLDILQESGFLEPLIRPYVQTSLSL